MSINQAEAKLLTESEYALIEKAANAIYKIHKTVTDRLEFNAAFRESRGEEDGSFGGDTLGYLFDNVLNDQYLELGLDHSERLALAQILLEGKDHLYSAFVNAQMEKEKAEADKQNDDEKAGELALSQFLLGQKMTGLRLLAPRLFKEHKQKLLEIYKLGSSLADVLSALDKVDPDNLEAVLNFVENILRPYLERLHKIDPQAEAMLPLLVDAAESAGLGKVSYAALQKMKLIMSKITAENEACTEEMYEAARKDGADLRDQKIIDNKKLAQQYGEKYRPKRTARIAVALALGPNLLDFCKDYQRSEEERKLLDQHSEFERAKGNKLFNGEVAPPLVSLEELVKIERSLSPEEQSEFSTYLNEQLKDYTEKTDYPVFVPFSRQKFSDSKKQEEYNNNIKEEIEKHKQVYLEKCQKYKEEHPNCGDFPILSFPILSFDNVQTAEQKREASEQKREAFAKYQEENKQYKQQLAQESRKQFEGNPLVVLAQRHQHYLALINEYIAHVNKAGYSEEDKREKLDIAFQAKAELLGRTVEVERYEAGKAKEKLSYKTKGTVLPITPNEPDKSADLVMDSFDDEDASEKDESPAAQKAPLPLAQRLKNFENHIKNNQGTLEKHLNSEGLTIIGRLLTAIPKLVASLVTGTKGLLKVGLFGTHGSALVSAVKVEAIAIPSPTA